jgi:hypothetical protein
LFCFVSVRNKFKKKLIDFVILATIGVQAMIAVTETERSSRYGETHKEN